MNDPAPAAPIPGPAAPATGSDHHRPFGGDRFGVLAERFARWFGTPNFIIGQTAMVALWIVINALAITHAIAWDRYPFIALNLAFSLQAAYAAPLILLAQTRQADRDKVRDDALQAHREAEARLQTSFEARQATELADDKALAEQHTELLRQNTELTEKIVRLAEELHATVCVKG